MAAVEVEHGDCMILALRLVAMDEGAEAMVTCVIAASFSIQRGERDAVAPHIHQHAATGAADIPEPGLRGPGMLLALLDQKDLASAPLFTSSLARTYFRREAEFSIHELHARLRARGDHSVGVLERGGERFLPCLPASAAAIATSACRSVRQCNRDEHH
ncbi:MAG: hypothetical protein M9947_00525 [Thermomicrobiales bacterium]|nr:hypothetical protein [Thermomicrobiales bacterium]